ncbi:MAG: hypothetical protein A2293_12310 [Elusimicrobia bacterium RIFOXYB2_FULL_49_7]|nr:MAG: hypothetical protein A2293_12310 [Elusimicrobia bacterium RIFOXYB2_FULL_49_7]
MSVSTPTGANNNKLVSVGIQIPLVSGVELGISYYRQKGDYFTNAYGFLYSDDMILARETRPNINFSNMGGGAGMKCITGGIEQLAMEHYREKCDGASNSVCYQMICASYDLMSDVMSIVSLAGMVADCLGAGGAGTLAASLANSAISIVTKDDVIESYTGESVYYYEPENVKPRDEMSPFKTMLYEIDVSNNITGAKYLEHVRKGHHFVSKDGFNVSAQGLGGSMQAYKQNYANFPPPFVQGQFDLFNMQLKFNNLLAIKRGEGNEPADIKTGLMPLIDAPFLNVSFGGFSLGSIMPIQYQSENIPNFPIFRFNCQAGGTYQQRVNSDKGNYAFFGPEVSRYLRNSNQSININGKSVFPRMVSGRDVNNSLFIEEKKYQGILPFGSIAGFDVVKEDGIRYVFGEPMLNFYSYDNLAEEKPQENANYIEDLIRDGLPNTFLGIAGLFGQPRLSDKYHATQIITPYAYAWGLTTIYGQNYCDINGNNKCDPEDLGMWVDITYKTVCGKYAWRTPFTGVCPTAMWQDEDIEANSDDDPKVTTEFKYSYSTGRKEVKVVDHIATATHVAYFKTSDREDALGASYGDAIKEGGVADPAQHLQKLEGIYLFLRQDVTFNATTGRLNAPNLSKCIRAIEFKYDYSLCQNVPNNKNTVNGQKGKLTLRSVVFKGRGLQGALPPYTFNYDKNPDYRQGAWDRWGMYKADFNDVGNNHHRDTDSNNVDAWSLSTIVYPDGGIMKMKYGSDDYSKVQDRPLEYIHDINMKMDAIKALIASNQKDQFDVIGLVFPKQLVSSDFKVGERLTLEGNIIFDPDLDQYLGGVISGVLGLLTGFVAFLHSTCENIAWLAEKACGLVKYPCFHFGTKKRCAWGICIRTPTVSVHWVRVFDCNFKDACDFLDPEKLAYSLSLEIEESFIEIGRSYVKLFKEEYVIASVTPRTNGGVEVLFNRPLNLGLFRLAPPSEYFSNSTSPVTTKQPDFSTSPSSATIKQVSPNADKKGMESATNRLAHKTRTKMQLTDNILLKFANIVTFCLTGDPDFNRGLGSILNKMFKNSFERVHGYKFPDGGKLGAIYQNAKDKSDALDIEEGNLASLFGNFLDFNLRLRHFAKDKYRVGGGIRVAEMGLDGGFGEPKVEKTYTYSSGSKSNGSYKSFGVATSEPPIFEHLFADNRIIKTEFGGNFYLPGPMVGYQKVIVTNKGDNSSVEYNHLTPADEIALDDGSAMKLSYAYIPTFYKSTTENNYKSDVSSRVYTNYDNFYGNVASILYKDNNGKVVKQVVNKYAPSNYEGIVRTGSSTGTVLPRHTVSTNEASYNKMPLGSSVEAYHSIYTFIMSFLPGVGIGWASDDRNSVTAFIRSTEHVEVGSILKEVVTSTDNVAVTKQNRQFDLYTGTPTQWAETNSDGSVLLTENIPAYKKYSGMGIGGAHMLTQLAEENVYAGSQSTANIRQSKVTRWGQYNGTAWYKQDAFSWDVDMNSKGKPSKTYVPFVYSATGKTDYDLIAQNEAKNWRYLGGANTNSAGQSDLGVYSASGKLIDEVSPNGAHGITEYDFRSSYPKAYIVNAQAREAGAFTGEYDHDVTMGSINYFNYDGAYLTGWAKGEATLYPTDAHTGSSCATVAGASKTGPNRLFKDITPDADYVVSAWILPKTTSGKAELRAIVENAGAGTEYSFKQEVSLTGQPARWQRVELRLPADILKSYFPTGTGAGIRVSCGTGSEGGTILIDDIRFRPVDAQMTTVTYDLGSGKVTSISGPDDMPTYYQYDENGRLIQVLNNNKEVIKDTDYRIQKKEHCFNKVDDDMDGLIDCQDPECNCME